MENEEIYTISYIEHEAAMFRKERIIKKLVAALVFSNVVFATVIGCIFFKKKR